MSKTNTHFCDYCHNEVQKKDIWYFAGHEFCCQTCAETYCQERS